MSLKKALDDCLIDFDRCVLVTDLLEEYKLPYKEVAEELEAYIKKQEPATKFKKRFLVHGKRRTQETSSGEELYTVVQESKLNDWISKVQDAETKLYSVEIAGGSKSPAAIFKPMQHLEVKLSKVEQRPGAGKTAPTTNGAPLTNGSSKSQVSKTETAKSSVKIEPSKTSVKTEPSKSEVKKSADSKENPSPETKKTSPKEQDSKTKPAAAKKGSINSFFTAAASKPKDVKATPSKSAASTMENFFKKQPPGAKKSPSEKKETNAAAKQDSLKKESPNKKSPSPTKKPLAANTSVQLFDAESAESSDEEEKLDKLRRNVIGSDDECDQKKPATSKRRRISDSEDEEQPPKKSAEQEVVAIDDEMDTEPANETYLDEEGFVITQRKPNKSQPVKKKVSPKAAAPANKKKSPPSAAKTGKDAPKTKQAGIMSFFAKK
ncbi:DNA polymerase delta subunit 3 [Drosophila ficusphila]|uniref:DNA polymerase delta subunit 3 n=1 Tax=Drosophila ficusphila TaxID=30025 RepID=UPI0007E7BD06|nr:DNA polymerase delta subunit 3 [Drosophila ficusphila]